jgi:competence protein ComEC
VAPSNPGEPDRRPRLRRAGVAYVGALERGALAVTKISTGWSRKAEVFRERFTAFVRERLGDGDRSALVAALAVGERGGVSVDLNNAFNASGLAHVLSISGLHLAVAVLALAWALRRLFALSAALSSWISPRRLAASVALPITAIYIVLIGAPAPAVRAGLGTALGRDADVLNTLGWSLAAIALMDPAALDQPSTQLSFVGVVGLVYFTSRLRDWVPFAAPRPEDRGARATFAHVREALLLLAIGTTAATLATAPITAYYFERTSLVAAAANVVAWPASTFIVPSGALAALLFPVAPGIAGYLVDIAGWCAWGLSWCASFFASWPAAAVHVPAPSLPAIAAYTVAIVCLVNARRWPLRYAMSGVGVGLVSLAWLSWKPLRVPGRLEVTFLSVGQGDSTVIRFPHGATMVVDAGGVISQRYDPGERVVTPFLQSQGVSTIDLLVASHPHPDHIGGLPSLLKQFTVGEFWHNGDVRPGGPLESLIKAARANGTTVRTFVQDLPAHCAGLPPLSDVLPQVAALSVGDPRCMGTPPVRSLDGVNIEVLHPLNGPERSAFPELGENDNSLVLRLTYGKTHVLLAGDVEKDGESILLARGVDLSADVLKAPHHGSRTSSTPALVSAVKPRHVVFCVGLNNQFNFPAEEVDRRYAEAHCARYRTDLDGAVTFATDGDQLTVDRFLAR